MSSNDKIRLTKRTVDAIEPAGGDVQVMDTELTGFGVRVKPSGVKSYFIRYRNTEHRQRRFVIGQHGKITVDQARKEALKLFALISEGKDPSNERDTIRKAPKMADLFERYTTEHVAVHNKPKTRQEVEGLLRTIRPKLEHHTVAGIERADILKLQRALKDTPIKANRVLSLLSKAFNLAEAWGWRPLGSNPCKHVKKYKEAARDRFLSDDEMQRLGAAMTELEASKLLAPGVADVIRLLALTGCRLGEVRRLRWDDVDFERSLILLPDSKTGKGEHVVGAATLALLAELPRLKGSPWVFPGIRNKGECIAESVIEHAWNGRIRKAAKLEEADTGLPAARLHDLRHTVGSYGGQLGANAFLLRDKLRHKTAAMTDRYVNRDRSPLRVLSDQIEGRVAANLFGKGDSEGGEVIPLKRR